MSGRLLSAHLVPLAQRANFQAVRRLSHHGATRVGGLLPSTSGLHAGRFRRWPIGASSIHNVPAIRSLSFARAIPSLFFKLLRLPALLGGAGIAGVAYIQYQTNQAGAYIVGVFGKAKASAGDAANSLFQGASDVAGQARRGWERTTDNIEMPAWMRQIFAGEESTGNGGGDGPNGKESKQSSTSPAHAAVGAGAASATAFGFSEEDDREAAKDDQMMLLTKKMIEIRSLLQTVGQSETLTLPSIVVVGSQSSGKSSVLEAIVGHEFLPKGSNMVTRRPIELTLVNTPDAKAEYCEFPALGLGKVTDFLQVQKTLTDLNLAVPETECVSDDPIQLRIYSPKIPDLSLIDLPGYIQVSGYDQPTELKTRISELCDKYIRAPNIILAISAADVDLANSTALRASRRVDPRGERTIGVVTKMDLVDAARGAAILADKNYPLRLGYVGVVSKVPQSSGLFARGGGSIQSAIARNENAYFSTHPEQFGPEADVTVGTSNLRKKLMYVLERTLAASLGSTSEAIQHELAEASYEFKVQYNDRPLSAESYLAESLDAFKHSFKKFSEDFGRKEIRLLLKHEIDQQILNILAQRYWNKPIEDLVQTVPESETLSELPKADAESTIWPMKLDASTASLTKLGIGRLAAGVVANSLQSHVEQLIANSTFAGHPFARQAITEASSNILRELSYDTSDELEICIKPYKYRIDVDDAEWAKGRENVAKVLKEELSTCDAAFHDVEGQVGGRKKLKDVVAFIDRVRRGDITLEGDGASGAGGFSSALLHKGREAVFLRDRGDVIKMRLAAVRSKQCTSPKNKYACPEVFLDAVADKLTTTADLFLDAELLSKFFYLFPRELDTRLGRNLSQIDIERFAREDPKIKKHLDVVKRKELLEHVLKEMESLQQLEDRERRQNKRSSRPDAAKEKAKGWSLF